MFNLKKDTRLFSYTEDVGTIEDSLDVVGLKMQIGESDDVIFRKFFINANRELGVTLVYIDGLISNSDIDEFVLKPLLQEKVLSTVNTEKEIIDMISTGVLYHNNMKIVDRLDVCLEELLAGHAALVFDSEKKAVTFDSKGFLFRMISEPADESVIKGARDSFVENFRVNISMVRNRLKSPKLRVKQFKIGRHSNTTVGITYLEGIVKEDIVKEVSARLQSIDIDGLLTASVIEEFIIENKNMVFPQLKYTERPDSLCGVLLEGRVGIFADGLPLAYTVPTTFGMFLRATDDYSFNYVLSSVTRVIRISAFLIALLVPAYYIAIGSFHQEMIPVDLAMSIIASKNLVPFPIFVEVMFMLIAFELLLEAGLRMPKAIGQSISIVGAIVIGQAAVSAKFMSPAVIVVIALAGISGYCIPNQDLSNTTRILRFILVICAAIGGLFGLMAGVLVICYLMSCMESFGVPYLSPIVSTDGKEIYQDTLFRFPLRSFKYRPSNLQSKNKRRQK